MHKGVSFDNVTAHARDGSQEYLFCEQFGLKKQFSAATHKYSEANAMLLCKMWCHKMSHFYSLYVECEEANRPFTLSLCKEYDEIGTFPQAELSLSPMAKTRLKQIRDLWPQGLPP